MFNTRYSGTDVEGLESDGYRRVGLNGRRFKAHRIIWKMVTGEDPSELIDHINGDRADNRWSNMRAGTISINSKNRKLPSNNTSGFAGVVFHKKSGKYQVCIRLNGVRHYLGSYEVIDEAALVARKFHSENGFSPRHGTSP